MKIEITERGLRILSSEAGHSLYSKDDKEFRKPIKKMYLAKGASPDDWVEVEDKLEE